VRLSDLRRNFCKAKDVTEWLRMGKRPCLYNEEKALRLMGQRPSECVAIFPLEGDISLGI